VEAGLKAEADEISAKAQAAENFMVKRQVLGISLNML
jgi:hypothetical protein